MELAGRLHPLLVHFPIGLVLFAAGAELFAIVTRRQAWRAAAVINVRAGALFAVITAIAGWLLARAPEIGRSATLEWHRWIATIATMAAAIAGLATFGANRSTRGRRIYQVLLFGAALAIAIAGHLGGLLVWGADYFDY